VAQPARHSKRKPVFASNFSGIQIHHHVVYPIANIELLQKVNATKENNVQIWRGIGLNLQAQYTP